MAKVSLQQRAEKAARDYRASQRPTIVVEFAGSPKAGKTSTLGQVYSFLRRCGFRCEVVVERASVCPIRDKRHFNFNVWTACTSIAQLLEKTQNPPRDGDPDILFLDRGIFDALCWFDLLEDLNRIRPEDHAIVSKFLLVKDWTSRITGVVAMTANPRDAMLREQGELPVEHLEGSIMNPIVLKQMDSIVKRNVTQFQNMFRTFIVNTSSQEFLREQRKTCVAVVTKILDWIIESNQENILSAPRNLFGDLSKDFVASKVKARKLVNKFEKQGTFEPRGRVEADTTRIQPLPIVIVRNKSGDVLQLVRKERDPNNKLHRKIVLWAGGHVRKEDGGGRSKAIVAGALRELQEELRLQVTESSLRLLGAVYVSVPGTQKHLAFVYEWQADSDDVQVALCRSEFMERGGTSLTGDFVSVRKIEEDQEGLEPWSVAILNKFLAKKIVEVA